MTIGIRALEWVNHNTQRSYPLALEATKVDLTGAFTLPDDFIVGLVLPVHFGLSIKTGKFFIRRIVSYASGYIITVGYDTDTELLDVAKAIVPKAAHKLGNYYNLIGLHDFVDSEGFVQIGSLSAIDGQPSGVFEFDFAGGQLEPDAIRPFIRDVMSLSVRNGLAESAKLTGRVVLAGGTNMRLRVVETEGEDPEIIFDAIDGLGLSEECICDASASGPVKTLSLVTPDANGNINLKGNSCFEIEAGTHELTIRDKCSEPCCGCPELEDITRTLEAFGSKATTLENFLVSLEARATQIDMVMLGSLLGDRGCVPAPSCD